MQVTKIENGRLQLLPDERPSEEGIFRNLSFSLQQGYIIQPFLRWIHLSINRDPCQRPFIKECFWFREKSRKQIKMPFQDLSSRYQW